MNFTVLITVYRSDKPALLKRALSSIYSNTIQPHSVLLIVDGPVPKQVINIINFFKFNNGLIVKYLSINIGLANALNYGLNFVDTDWVVRADSDDFNRPNRFETLIN
jgi:glycosyltransferase involved in cell wall biosynthesis